MAGVPLCHEPPRRGQSEWCHLPLQALQTLFSAPRLGEPGARTPLFTPETDKLRLDSPFPFLGSGKSLGVLGEICTFEGRGAKMRDRKEDGGRRPPRLCAPVRGRR